MFALVDVNSFYASYETIFRPDIRGKPVVVLSYNDGCVIARSAEAKALQIPMGRLISSLRMNSDGKTFMSSAPTMRCSKLSGMQH